MNNTLLIFVIVLIVACITLFAICCGYTQYDDDETSLLISIYEQNFTFDHGMPYNATLTLLDSDGYTYTYLLTEPNIATYTVQAYYDNGWHTEIVK